MMTSSNGNTFRVTGHLCGEFTAKIFKKTDVNCLQNISHVVETPPCSRRDLYQLVLDDTTDAYLSMRSLYPLLQYLRSGSREDGWYLTPELCSKQYQWAKQMVLGVTIYRMSIGKYDDVTPVTIACAIDVRCDSSAMTSNVHPDISNHRQLVWLKHHNQLIRVCLFPVVSNGVSPVKY